MSAPQQPDIGLRWPGRAVRRRLGTGTGGFPPLRLAALLFGLLLVLALPPCTSRAGVLVVNTAAREPRSLPDGSGPQDRIVKEAFRRIGEQVSIVNQPPERALTNANEGLLDGDCWRVDGQSEQYPNLIMVPEPVDVATIKAFTWDPDLAVGTWEDLKPCNVAYINGWKILDARVHGTRSLIKVKNIDSLFTLLAMKRIDVALVDPVMGWAALRRMQLSGIRVLEPPLTRQNMYIYLHKRHADLVPRLAGALRQMRRDGTLERLTRAGQLSNGHNGAGQETASQAVAAAK